MIIKKKKFGKLYKIPLLYTSGLFCNIGAHTHSSLLGRFGLVSVPPGGLQLHQFRRSPEEHFLPLDIVITLYPEDKQPHTSDYKTEVI